MRQQVDNVIYTDAFTRVRESHAHKLFCAACEIDEDEKRRPEAEELYRQALDLNPTFQDVIVNLGNLLYHRGDRVGAEQHYRRSLAIDADHVESLYNLAYCLHQCDRNAEAALWYARALQRDPNFADAHFNLALALDELGERNAAQKHWRKYLELDPQGEWSDIARKCVRK